MAFVHEDPDFDALLTIVAEERGIARALVEKDYWVTHALWALHQTQLDVWFKGGTSLSKGFGLIDRFSEDLDLRIEPGRAAGVPPVASWTSANKGRVENRKAFFAALESAIRVPDARVVLDDIDPRARAPMAGSETSTYGRIAGVHRGRRHLAQVPPPASHPGVIHPTLRGCSHHHPTLSTVAAARMRPPRAAQRHAPREADCQVSRSRGPSVRPR